MIELQQPSSNKASDKMMQTGNNLLARMRGSAAPLLAKGGEKYEAKNGDLSTHEPCQVEPKTYFANERTFIQWISAALLLLTVSSIMMGSGSFNGTSSVISSLSLVLVTYASFVYFRRIKLLQSGNTYGYLDFVGPAVLAGGVGLGVFIILADAIKGSEVLPWGSEKKEEQEHHRRYDRHLMSNIVGIKDAEGHCSPYSIKGINMLEYLPKDILLRQQEHLIVATPQSLVSHSLSEAQDSAVLSQFSDIDIQSITLVDGRVFALSAGPSKTELLEITANEIESRLMIKESITKNGSMVFVPSSTTSSEKGKLYIYLDGTMDIYEVPSKEDEALTLVGSVNMKVLNGGLKDDENPITAMEYFDGLTYILRDKQNTIEGWDLKSGTLVTEMFLPTLLSENDDKWVGMAFQREVQEDKQTPLSSSLRGKNQKLLSSSVTLYMPLDTFPPQLWSFHLDEKTTGIFSFPPCDGVAPSS